MPVIHGEVLVSQSRVTLPGQICKLGMQSSLRNEGVGCEKKGVPKEIEAQSNLLRFYIYIYIYIYITLNMWVVY